MLGSMDPKALEELIAEIDSSLEGNLSSADRARLEQVRADLATALAAELEEHHAPSLRARLRSALEQLEGEHPQLTSLLGKTLDALSDVGV